MFFLKLFSCKKIRAASPCRSTVRVRFILRSSYRLSPSTKYCVVVGRTWGRFFLCSYIITYPQVFVNSHPIKEQQRRICRLRCIIIHLFVYIYILFLPYFSSFTTASRQVSPDSPKVRTSTVPSSCISLLVTVRVAPRCDSLMYESDI